MSKKEHIPEIIEEHERERHETVLNRPSNLYNRINDKLNKHAKDNSHLLTTPLSLSHSIEFFNLMHFIFIS